MEISICMNEDESGNKLISFDAIYNMVNQMADRIDFGAFNLNLEIEEQRHSTVKPFLKWVGGKRQLIPEIVKYLPRTYGHYFEPFLGGGALFFSQLPKNATISDVNEELVNCYQVVKQDPTALIAELKTYIYDKEYYYQMRNLDRDPVAFSTLTNVARACGMAYLFKPFRF